MTVTMGELEHISRYFEQSEVNRLTRWLEAERAEYIGDGNLDFPLDVHVGYNFRPHDRGMYLFSGDVSYDTHHCDVCAAGSLESDTDIRELAVWLLMGLCEEIDLMHSEVGK